MSGPFEEASYLLRSEHRVRALDLLATEPHTLDGLDAETEASRKTLRRLLGRFEDYGWVDREDGRYELTPAGSLLAEAAEGLLDAATAARKLRVVSPWLPGAIPTDDLSWIANARLTLPESADTVAPARRMVAVMEAASRVRVVAFAVVPGAIEATRKNATDCSLVLAAETLAFIAEEPSMAGELAAMLDAGRDVRRSSEPIPYNLVVADRTVMLGLVDAHGAPSVLVETEDDAVRSWAIEEFEAFHERATPVEPATFRA
jgi:predicted transcriptional regulator